MEQIFHTDSQLFSWVILPLLIFLARICDVTLGTIRIIFVSRGNKLIAPLLGFFEVFVWIMVIGQLMQHLNGLIYYVAYAAGFATGNYVGIFMEEKLAMGILIVRIITTKDSCGLSESLSKEGYGVTRVDAQGSHGDVKVIYTIIKRKDLRNVLAIINKCDAKVFYTIEDVRTAYKGVFPAAHSKDKEHHLSLFRLHRLLGGPTKKK